MIRLIYSRLGRKSNNNLILPLFEEEEKEKEKEKEKRNIMKKEMKSTRSYHNTPTSMIITLTIKTN